MLFTGLGCGLYTEKPLAAAVRTFKTLGKVFLYKGLPVVAGNSVIGKANKISGQVGHF